jgi:hypothetical protein
MISSAVMVWRRASEPAPLATLDFSSVQGPWLEAAPARSAAYAGDASCRECHPGESALFSRSGHRHTLSPAVSNRLASWLNGRTVRDPERAGVNWSYHIRGGALVVERAQAGEIASLPLDYALGSGKHGVTFVAIEQSGAGDSDVWGIEHRLSYFPEQRLAITPGQQRSVQVGDDEHLVDFGREVTPERMQRCFACHATATSSTRHLRLDLATMIPNVSCERCHGPGLAHVESARRGGGEVRMRFGSERVEPAVEVTFCGECHRVPAAIPSSWIDPKNLNIVRFQGVGLSLSRCYADGLRELRCTSCHEPHARVSTDHAAYNAVCLSCHRLAPGQPSCPVSPKEDCTRCHMPRREVPGSGDFTDHWIRKNSVTLREKGAPPPQRNGARPTGHDGPSGHGDTK